MKLDRKSLLCLACFSAVLSLTVFAQDSSDRAAVAVATKTISASEIRAHIRFLADSLLQPSITWSSRLTSMRQQKVRC
jgi:hypothetical protein